MERDPTEIPSFMKGPELSDEAHWQRVMSRTAGTPEYEAAQEELRAKEVKAPKKRPSSRLLITGVAAGIAALVLAAVGQMQGCDEAAKAHAKVSTSTENLDATN